MESKSEMKENENTIYSLTSEKEIKKIFSENKTTSSETRKSKLLKNWYLAFCLFFAVFGSSFQYGYNIGLYNTPYAVIKSFFNQVYKDRTGVAMPNSTFTVLWSIHNGILPLGGIFGAMFSGWIADGFGRRYGLLMANILIIFGALLNISSKIMNSYECLIAGRLFAGFFSGLSCSLLPLFLMEISPNHLRGVTGSMNQLTIVIGILISNILGLPFFLGTHSLWPVLVSLIIVPSVAQIIGLYFACESPKFLFINQGKEQEAENALNKLRGQTQSHLVKLELEQLKAEKEALFNQKKSSWSDFLNKKSLYRPLFIAVVIKIAQHFSGINAVAFYSTKIFENVGLRGAWPTYITILLSCVQVIMTSVCMIIIERVGRRSLLIYGCIGMCISAFTVALSRINSSAEKEWLYYVTVVAAITYLICYSISLGPISWILVTELFDSSSRGKANTIASFFNWSANFLVTVSFPFIESAIKSYSFLVYGFILILITLFVIVFVPETKHKSIEDIVQNFEIGMVVFPARKSTLSKN